MFPRTGTVEERVQRKLAAILAPDVVGYSRLVGANEEVTHDVRMRAARFRRARLIWTRMATPSNYVQTRIKRRFELCPEANARVVAKRTSRTMA